MMKKKNDTRFPSPPSRLRDGSSASFCPYLLLWKYVCFPYSVFLSLLFACLVFYFHISCILYEVEGQGWLSCHPGRAFVCGTGRTEVLSRWGFLYQLWNKSCMEAQPQHRGEQKEQLVNPRTLVGHMLCCAAGNKACRAGIHVWRRCNLRLLKIFHWHWQMTWFPSGEVN